MKPRHASGVGTWNTRPFVYIPQKEVTKTYFKTV